MTTATAAAAAAATTGRKIIMICTWSISPLARTVRLKKNSQEKNQGLKTILKRQCAGRFTAQRQN